VFPLAARLLSSTEKTDIADEMAARGKVSLVTSTHGVQRGAELRNSEVLLIDLPFLRTKVQS